MPTISKLFYLAVSVALGLAVFVLILRLAHRVPVLSGGASIAENLTGIAA